MAEPWKLENFAERDAEHPDALDQISGRAVHLFNEALAAVTAKEET